MKSCRKAKKGFFLSVFIFLILPLQMFPCFILKIAHGNLVFAGNNEDIDNPLSKIWFEPPEKGKYGITYFGYGINYPQGGMNDQGLFFDAVAGYKTDWKVSPKRLHYYGNLNRKIMEECATVEEAIAVYDKYNKSSFQYARYLLADRTGASAIVGWIDGELKFIRDKGKFQAIGVNEDTGVSMLKSIKENKKIVNVDDVKEVLKACHVEGRYPTQYSNICDLKNNVVYMYLYHDYSTVVKFNATKEYKKGKHNYPLLHFFPNNAKAKDANEIYRKSLLNLYEKVIENPTESATRYGWRELSLLGLELTDYEEYKKAVEVLKITLEHYPEWRSYSNLAYGYRMVGDIQLAIENYKKVLQLDAKNQNALKALKELKQKKGNKSSVSKTLMPGELYSNDKIVGNMRYVPATGPEGFIQGSPLTEPGHHREAPFTHILTKNIAVMETEVTRQMWADLKALQPNLPPDPTDIQRGSGKNNPIQGISWYQAILFANLLSVQNGLKCCYYRDRSLSTLVSSSRSDPVFCDFSADGYRLPTEGEWEYFARAGTTNPFSIHEPNYNSETFYSGNASDLPNLAKVAVFSPMENGKTWPVRSLKPNPWNLYDVHGNVWEWVWDRYDNYPKGTVTDYTGPLVSSLGIGDRSQKSGGWTMVGAKWVRSAARGHGIRGGIDQGFRLVRTIAAPKK